MKQFYLFLLIAALLAGIFTFASLQAGSILLFSFDDAYILHCYAKNFAKGLFLTYSPNEPLSSGTTDFLYYLFLSVLYKLTGYFSQGESQILIVNYLCLITSALLLALSIFMLQKIISYLNSKISISLSIMALISGNIVFTYFSGLGYPITTTLIIGVLYSYLFLSEKFLVLILCALSISRPEGFVSATGLSFLFLTRILSKDLIAKEGQRFSRLTYLCPILVGIALLVTYYYFTGNISSTSAARVGMRGSLFDSIHGTIYGLANLQPRTWLLTIDAIRGAIFPQSIVVDEFNFNTSLMKHLLSSVVVWMVAILIINIILNIHRLLINKLFLLCVSLILTYLAIPVMFTTGFGEWGRYTSGLFFNFYNFIFDLWKGREGKGTFLNIYIIFIKLTVIIGVATLPIWIVYHSHCVRFMSDFHLKMARHICEKTPPQSKIAISEAGILNLFSERTSIDIYGLGTTRFSQLKYLGGEAQLDYIKNQLIIDRPNYVVSYNYKNQYNSDLIEKLSKIALTQKILSISLNPGHYYLYHKSHPNFPKEMFLHKLTWKD